MQVQVHTDNHIEGSAELAGRVESKVTTSLGRFASHITRVEVHLADLNGHKGGERDKRCVMEARVAGFDPIPGSHEAETIDEAVSGAAEVLLRNLDRAIGKLSQKKGRMSYGGDESP